MNCSPPGSTVHEIFQARTLEWLPLPALGDLPNPGDESISLASPTLVVRFFTSSTTWEDPLISYNNSWYTVFKEIECLSAEKLLRQHRNIYCRVKIIMLEWSLKLWKIHKSWNLEVIIYKYYITCKQKKLISQIIEGEVKLILTESPIRILYKMLKVFSLIWYYKFHLSLRLFFFITQLNCTSF